MKFTQRRQADRGRWEGITLIEVMLVLVILVLVAATAWPSLERSFADQRLRDSAGMLSAQWARARAKAMSSGVAYQFCYTSEDSSFWIEPCEEAAASSNDPASSAERSTNAKPDEMVLPEQVVFLEGRVCNALADEANTDQTSTGGQPWDLDNGERDAPIVFSPDGTCSAARIILENEYDRSISVTTNALTGMPIVSEVTSTEGGTR